MKKALLLLAAVLILPMYTFAQNGWEFESILPADSSVVGIHGLAFDHDGRLWAAHHYTATIDGEPTNPIYCIDPVTKDFCEDIPYLIGTTQADTLLRFANHRGLATAPDGTILVFSAGYRSNADQAPVTAVPYIHRFDPATGEGVAAVGYPGMGPIHGAVDRYGDIFISSVLPDHPIVMLDEDFEFVLNVVDSRPAFARSIAVFTDENDVTRVYQPTNFTTVIGEGDDAEEVGGRVAIYEGDFIAGFTPLDTLSLIGMDPGAASVYPGNGVLFVPASGSGGAPEGDPERWDALTIYGINVKGAGDIDVVDQLTWHFGDADPFNPVYRGMAISKDGLNLAVGGFTSTTPVQWFTRDSVLEIETSAGERLSELPEGYNLGQNYPNPFNPTTQISFEIGQAGMTSLKVYDLLGREVATLVNSDLPAGSHTIDFDAANLASGTYMYRLEANGYVLTRKMMLVK